MRIIGNDDIVKNIRNLILGTKAFLICVIGNGRTYICNEIFNNMDIEVIRINSEDVKNIDYLKSIIESQRDVYTIDSFFFSRPKVIFMDDFDDYGIEKVYQKYILDYILHENFNASMVKIILTISNKNEKHFKTFCKHIKTIRIKDPDPVNVFKFYIDMYPNLNKDNLKKVCHEMQGNMKYISNNIPCINNIFVEKSMYDIIDMLYKKQIKIKDSDIIYSYDPKIVFMIYYENIVKHKISIDDKLYLSSTFADLHILEKSLNDNHLLNHLLCKYICLLPPVKLEKNVNSKKYNFTNIVSKTIQRYNNNKFLTEYTENIDIDNDSRDILFEVYSNNILESDYGKNDQKLYDVCKKFLVNIGEINKMYLEKII